MLLLNWQARLGKQGIDDLGDYFQKPDTELLDELSDPANEHLILKPDASNARRRQRRRVEQLRGQLARKYHNVRIGKQWSDTEWHDMISGRYEYGPDVEQSEMWRRWRHDITACVSRRQCSWRHWPCGKSQIWLYCLLWRILPVPSVVRWGKVEGGRAITWSAPAIVWAASLFHPVEWRFLSGFRFHAAWKTPELDLTYLYGQWKTAFSTAALAHGEDIAEALDARI